VRANLSLLRSRLGEQQQPQEDHISFARTTHTNQEPALPGCWFSRKNFPFIGCDFPLAIQYLTVRLVFLLFSPSFCNIAGSYWSVKF
jgi:hypothetical protein